MGFEVRNKISRVGRILQKERRKNGGETRKIQGLLEFLGLHRSL